MCEEVIATKGETMVRKWVEGGKDRGEKEAMEKEEDNSEHGQRNKGEIRFPFPQKPLWEQFYFIISVKIYF